MQPMESAPFGSRNASSYVLSYVLDVPDVGKHLFLKVHVPDRGRLACVCREWAAFARAFWNVGKGEPTDVHTTDHLRCLSGGDVAKVVTWIYPRFDPRRFCALTLGKDRLEWLTIESWLPPGCVVDTVKLIKAVILIGYQDENEDGHREAPLQGLCSFALSKKNTFCVVILRGKAMMLKITRKISRRKPRPTMSRSQRQHRR